MQSAASSGYDKFRSLRLGAWVGQSSKRRPPTTEVTGSSPIEHLIARAWEEFVNTLPKVMGVLRVLRVPFTGKVDRI